MLPILVEESNGGREERDAAAAQVAWPCSMQCPVRAALPRPRHELPQWLTKVAKSKPTEVLVAGVSHESTIAVLRRELAQKLALETTFYTNAGRGDIRQQPARSSTQQEQPASYRGTLQHQVDLGEEAELRRLESGGVGKTPPSINLINDDPVAEPPSLVEPPLLPSLSPQ